MVRKTLYLAISFVAVAVLAAAPAGAGSAHPSGNLGCNVTGHIAPTRVAHGVTSMKLTLHGTGTCPYGSATGGRGPITGADAVATWTTKAPSCAEPYGDALSVVKGAKVKVTWTGAVGVIGTAVVKKMYAQGTDTTGTEWHLHSGEKIKGASFKGNTVGFVLTTTDPDYYANCPAHPNAPADTDVTGYINTIVPQ